MFKLLNLLIGALVGSAAVLLIAAVLWMDASDVVSAGIVDSAQRHHSQVLHAAQLRHAAHLRSARRWWWEHQAARVDNHYFDVRTPRTRDWRCIRLLEEGMQAAPANEYGFVPFSPMSEGSQDALALSILKRAGWAAWSTAPACGLR